MKTLPLILSLTLAVAPFAMSLAGDPPVAAKACPEISAADLQKAIADKKVTVIDCNGTASFNEGHVPGAIDFAAAKADLASKLPADKSALIVSYCGGPECNAYKSGCDAAVALGYTNISHMKVGISGWKAAKMPVEAAK